MLKTILYATMIVGIYCAPATAQSPCTKPESETPAIRGLKLGMTVDEVKQFQPLIKDETDETGYFEVKSPDIFVRDASLRGVAAINLGFLDHSLVSIVIAYDDGIKWETLRQFATAVGNTLKVPDLWEGTVDPSNNVGVLQVVCGKITYGVGGQGGSPIQHPVFVMYRNDTKPIREARRTQIEETKRRTFKP